MTAILRGLGSASWIVPLAVHVGYILATFDHFPGQVGGDGEIGRSTRLFFVEWFAIVGVAGLALAAVHVRLPRLSDRMLAVPGKEYWLADAERRRELVERLRGICEVALVMMNVFFLAVYQSIYQANVASPIVRLPDWMLIGAFMALPLACLVCYLLWSLHSLAAIARGGRWAR